MDVYNSKCPSIYRGKVISNDDPMKLGRCKIRVPSVNSDNSTINTLPWARPIVLSPISGERGSVSIPDVGDIVWVMFEGANKQFPIYFGGTYSTGDIPVDMTKETIYLEDGNKLQYDRVNKSYEINIGENVIKISRGGISLIGEVRVLGDLKVSKSLIAESIEVENTIKAHSINAGSISISDRNILSIIDDRIDNKIPKEEV